jgi:class 3 adenylate cyclase
MDVADWLRALGLELYETAFRENAVDAEVLPTLTADDLKEMGVVPIGHRRRLLDAIALLRLKDTPADDHVRSPISPPQNLGSPETTAERRPLSVMFCDLIGSTALSSRLDPGDLREVIRSYQASVATTIQRFDGFIARYVGDGVLIYFGWPEARETDAESAVRAGLAVAAAVSNAPIGGHPLQVRVGIATGLVVIGEPIGSGDSRQQTAVGETPNLAARLQGLAGPNQVVIARLLARAENLQAFCAEHLFPYWAAMASSIRGFALSLLGQTDLLALATKGWPTTVLPERVYTCRGSSYCSRNAIESPGSQFWGRNV